MAVAALLCQAFLSGVKVKSLESIVYQKGLLEDCRTKKLANVIPRGGD